MLDIIEDSRNEFKLKLNDKLEKEVISFLTANGGNIYIGVDDDGNVVGVDDLDEVQLKIKNRIKNNILPSTLGLFDIDVEEYDGKKVIHITVAAGNEKPYYLKKKGMIPDGCFIRVGSSCEMLSTNKIEELYARRTKTSLTDIKSPRQDLSFAQLKIYYQEKGYSINDNFLRQLGLVMDDGRYNYLAYLLADDNNISIKVATYSGNDAYDLIESEEYGYCCLVKAAKNVINKFEQINKTFTRITSVNRNEVKMFDDVAIKEAILNAFVHTLWEREYPPKFEIFADHIAISSTGGLPINTSKEDFLRGFSAPTHPELMRVFKDLDMAEQLGTGVIRILKAYDKSIYEFSDNFIRVNFGFKNGSYLPNTPRDISTGGVDLSDVQKGIIRILRSNSGATQVKISKELGVNKSTVTRNINKLKEKNLISRIGSTKSGIWHVN